MIKIIDTRDSGKTRKLLTECAKDPDALFVCAHPLRVEDKCKAYGLPVVEATSYEAFIKDYMMSDRSLFGKNIYIDEIENFTKSFIKLKGYSLSLD